MMGFAEGKSGTWAGFEPNTQERSPFVALVIGLFPIHIRFLGAFNAYCTLVFCISGTVCGFCSC